MNKENLVIEDFKKPIDLGKKENKNNMSETKSKHIKDLEILMNNEKEKIISLKQKIVIIENNLFSKGKNLWKKKTKSLNKNQS